MKKDRTLRKGFTLIELMIVIAIIAVIAAIAIPTMLSARLNSNELAAQATLRTIISAQAAFKARATVDGNNNGAGEYGTFAELASGQPRTLSSGFATITNGMANRSGYRFAMFLPDSGGLGIAEEDGGGRKPAVDSTLAESFWCCYAWPNSYGKSGNKTFFVNQLGDVMECDPMSEMGNQTPYTGNTSPNADAGFEIGSLVNGITGRIAAGITGIDGNFWKVQ